VEIQPNLLKFLVNLISDKKSLKDGNFVGQAFRPAYRKAKALPYKKNNLQL